MPRRESFSSPVATRARLYLLARDGHVLWRLGGTRSDSSVRPRWSSSASQHDARLHPDGLLLLFDNGAIPKLEPFTRPLVLKIDETECVASIVKTFIHPLKIKISAPYEGNLQLLQDGGAFVGWGGVPKITEFTRSGQVRFELKLPYGDTYRGYRLPWRRPARRPSRDRGRWRPGLRELERKTDVAFWEVVIGPDADQLSRLAGHDWAGLETAIQLETPPPAVAVRALDARGRVLGVSKRSRPERLRLPVGRKWLGVVVLLVAVGVAVAIAAVPRGGDRPRSRTRRLLRRSSWYDAT